MSNTQVRNDKEYLENAQGYLVPIDKVAPLDRAKHELVLELIEKGKSARAQLSDIKRAMMADVAAFVSLSAEDYGVKLGGNKGNITLYSYDAKYKISRDMAENITFDERLQAARELINQCLVAWTEGSNANLRALVDRAFDMDKGGNLSAGRILGLRRLKIDDERWQEAMRAIADSVQVTGSKAYIRMYERDENGKYQPIVLDMAGV